MAFRDEYQLARGSLINDGGHKLIELERSIADKFLKILVSNAAEIKADFDEATYLKPFWVKYAPVQRGHKPRGEAFPWGEVGEKVLEGYLYSKAQTEFDDVRFIGVPYGHDVRFSTSEAFIHIDIKATGPTDNIDEVVSSPNQVTGDGVLDADGVMSNSPFKVKGLRKIMDFNPELAPFVLYKGKVLPVITFYLKVVYAVVKKGNQPLEHLELICVPNGLLMFDGPNYSSIDKLFTPGKDEVHVKRKRTRIKLDPLASIEKWRCSKIIYSNDGTAQIKERG